MNFIEMMIIFAVVLSSADNSNHVVGDVLNPVHRLLIMGDAYCRREYLLHKHNVTRVHTSTVQLSYA